MKGPYYLYETLKQEPTHVVDRIAAATDATTLKGLRAVSGFTLAMYSTVTAYTAPGLYESDKFFMQLAVEHNSIPVSAAVGTLVVSESLLAVVLGSSIAEASSWVGSAHRRLQELRDPYQ